MMAPLPWTCPFQIFMKHNRQQNSWNKILDSWVAQSVRATMMPFGSSAGLADPAGE